jgi:hypothetical protein
MLNTRQTKAAAIVRTMKPATLDTISRAVYAAKVANAAARAGVHPKYRSQFDEACGLPSDAVALL